MKNKISIGTAQFGLNYGISGGTQVSNLEAKNILELGIKNNIVTVDTAFNYGNCHSILGDIGIKNKNEIITKLPEIPLDANINIENWIIDKISSALKDLKIEVLHGVLLHRPAQLLLVEGEKIYNALRKLKSSGLVNKIGISIYEPSELDDLIPRFNFDIVQSPFSIFDQRLIESGWLNTLNRLNIEIHVRSIFLQGLLLFKEPRPKKFDRWADLWQEWDNYLINSNKSALENCLQFVYSQEKINKIIIGIDSYQQFSEIININFSNENINPKKFNIKEMNLLVNPSKWEEL
jgi:aryl-alcohol dehydrogenase-like predicted oxidoreductase